MYALIDGDGYCYRTAFACESQSESAACRYFDHLITTLLRLPGIGPERKGYLSGSGNFRDTIAVTAVYKGTRTREKPQHLAAIRKHAHEVWGFDLSHNEEADDMISIEHTRRQYKSIIVSDDKDFLQLPGKHYLPGKDKFVTITPAQGLHAFYKQILTGDVADNIIGLQGIGPVKSEKLLEGCYTAMDYYLACVRAYNGDTARVLENGRLLWLRRFPGELWTPPKLPGTATWLCELKEMV